MRLLHQSTVRSDDMILRYDALQLRKKGPHAVYEISQRMRYLAMFRMELTSGVPMALLELLRPLHFVKIITATEEESGMFLDSDQRNCSRISAMRHSLHKCAQVKRGMAIRNGDTVEQTESENFIKLYTYEYTDLIASAASATFSSRKVC
jgi:hypothetical protein